MKYHHHFTLISLRDPYGEWRHSEAELVVVAARGVMVRVRGQAEAAPQTRGRYVILHRLLSHGRDLGLD